jgi:hypothetical protein
MDSKIRFCLTSDSSLRFRGMGDRWPFVDPSGRESGRPFWSLMAVSQMVKWYDDAKTGTVELQGKNAQPLAA